MLTAIGGITGNQRSNAVHSLKVVSCSQPLTPAGVTGLRCWLHETSLKDGREWVDKFPPMPTERASATSVCTETSLIVVGGMLGRSVRILACTMPRRDNEHSKWPVVYCC